MPVGRCVRMAGPPRAGRDLAAGLGWVNLGGLVMRIFLTGGAGYIGSACLRWLLRHGHDPIAYDDLSEGNATAIPDGRLVVGDLADADQMAEVMRKHRTEAVMHFAALASVPDSIA